jgi:hypothetical protein
MNTRNDPRLTGRGKKGPKKTGIDIAVTFSVQLCIRIGF